MATAGFKQYLSGKMAAASTKRVGKTRFDARGPLEGSTDFRCEHCGKLLSVTSHEGQAVKCPHCQRRVSVPQGLASLPRPQIPGVEVPLVPATAGQTSPEGAEQQLAQESAVSKTMTAIMPWVLSVLLHLGVGLIAGFIAVATIQRIDRQTSADAIYVPGEDFSQSPGGVTQPGDPGAEDTARQHDQQHSVTGYSHHDSEVTGSFGGTGQVASIISAGGGGGLAGGGWAQFGPGSGGSGRGPRSAFLGSGGNAHHVIFCIDASGSMAMANKGGGSEFDNVRAQMLTSISRLAPVQDFHIVMFQSGPPIEPPARRLQPVTPESRTAAARWLSGVVPHGAGSDPVPALNRCFDVLANADNARKGKQIFLLTDGAFPNNDEVLRCVKNRNKAHDVHVFTYLYGQQDDPSIIKLMKDIAFETGGKYKNVTE